MKKIKNFFYLCCLALMTVFVIIGSGCSTFDKLTETEDKYDTQTGEIANKNQTDFEGIIKQAITKKIAQTSFFRELERGAMLGKTVPEVIAEQLLLTDEDKKAMGWLPVYIIHDYPYTTEKLHVKITAPWGSKIAGATLIKLNYKVVYVPPLISLKAVSIIGGKYYPKILKADPTAPETYQLRNGKELEAFEFIGYEE